MITKIAAVAVLAAAAAALQLAVLERHVAAPVVAAVHASQAAPRPSFTEELEVVAPERPMAPVQVAGR